MIDRRAFLGLVGTIAMTMPSRGSQAQQGKVFRIGSLTLSAQPKFFHELWLRAMREIGYIEGENVHVEVRAGAPKDLRTLASELSRVNLDLMLCVSSAPVRATMAVTRTVPVVALDLETDPVASGFAATLAHPGGNLTGWFLDFPEFSAKQLEILKETLPALTQVMVLWDPAMERAPLSGFESASRALRLRVLVREVDDDSMLQSMFEDAVAKKVGAVLVMQSPTLVGYTRQIAKLAADFRLPLMGMFTYFTADGALLSYGPNVDDMYRRTTVYIDQILKGTKPGDLPIRRPEKFDFVVNMRTARALGVKIPPSVLARADEVIR